MADPGTELGSGMSVPRLFVDGVSAGEEPLDRYTAGIELSNACRKFYVSRLAAAERAKQRLGLRVTACTSIDMGEDAERESNPSSSDTCSSEPTSDIDTGSTCEQCNKAAKGVTNGINCSHTTAGSREESAPKSRLQTAMETLKGEMVSKQ